MGQRMNSNLAVVAAALWLAGCTAPYAFDDDDGGPLAVEGISKDDGSSAPGGPSSPPTDDDPVSCAWPQGQAGVAQGQMLPESLSWQGYVPGTAESVIFTARDVFDCDGSRGIHAVLFSTAMFGCGACYQEMNELEGLMNSWEPMGIKVVVLLINSQTDGLPTLSDAALWKSSFNLQRVSVLIDPYYALVPPNVTEIGTPMQTIVDPRTMLVHHRIDGLPSHWSMLESIAINNGAGQ